MLLPLFKDEFVCLFVFFSLETSGGCCCYLSSIGAVRKENGIQNHSIRRKQCSGVNCMCCIFYEGACKTTTWIVLLGYFFKERNISDQQFQLFQYRYMNNGVLYS